MLNEEVLVPLPLNIHGHLNPQIGGGLIRLPQSGEGLGQLLKTFMKWIVPAGKTALKSVVKTGVDVGKQLATSQVVKDAANVLKKDAINAGIDVAQTALQGGDVKSELKTKTNLMKQNLSKSISGGLNRYRPEDTTNTKEKKKRKPTGKSIFRTKIKRPKLKKYIDNLS